MTARDKIAKSSPEIEWDTQRRPDSTHAIGYGGKVYYAALPLGITPEEIEALFFAGYAGYRGEIEITEYEPGLTCYGEVRGCCGHRHETEEEAARCLDLDADRCARAGGYSDRCAYRIDDMHQRTGRDAEWYIPACAGIPRPEIIVGRGGMMPV